MAIQPSASMEQGSSAVQRMGVLDKASSSIDDFDAHSAQPAQKKPNDGVTRKQEQSAAPQPPTPAATAPAPAPPAHKRRAQHVPQSVIHQGSRSSDARPAAAAGQSGPAAVANQALSGIGNAMGYMLGAALMVPVGIVAAFGKLLGSIVAGAGESAAAAQRILTHDTMAAARIAPNGYDVLSSHLAGQPTALNAITDDVVSNIGMAAALHSSNATLAHMLPQLTPEATAAVRPLVARLEAAQARSDLAAADLSSAFNQMATATPGTPTADALEAEICDRNEALDAALSENGVMQRQLVEQLWRLAPAIATQFEATLAANQP